MSSTCCVAFAAACAFGLIARTLSVSVVQVSFDGSVGGSLLGLAAMNHDVESSGVVVWIAMPSMLSMIASALRFGSWWLCANSPWIVIVSFLPIWIFLICVS